HQYDERNVGRPKNDHEGHLLHRARNVSTANVRSLDEFACSFLLGISLSLAQFGIASIPNLQACIRRGDSRDQMSSRSSPTRLLEFPAACRVGGRRHLRAPPHVSRRVTFRCCALGTIVIFEPCFTLLGLALRTRWLRLATAGALGVWS